MEKPILRGLEVGPFMSNCYIVGSAKDKTGVVIDAGADGEAILKEIEDAGLTIKFIVVTHGHTDHVSAVKEVKDATGAEFLIHKADVPLLQAASSRLAALYGLNFPAPPAPDRLLEGGEQIEVGELSFLVLHTPGHSPGGICLCGHGIVFTGDTLFNLSIGRFDMPGADGRALLTNIHTKLMVLPDATVVYPGHGPQTTIGTERQWNPFLQESTFKLL